MKENKILKLLKIALLGTVVAIIGIYFMSQKENLDIDEIYTFGLSNSSFQLNIEDFKEYTGDELLKNYATVKEDNKFDIANVFFNQKMDTHPPLYYMIVNFICSINAGKFSMWYGLIINLIFLVILYFQMSYLLNLIIKDNIISYVLSVLALFLYGFINEMVFIRMYVMLSVISMSFIILIIKKIEQYEHLPIDYDYAKKNNDIKMLNSSFKSPNNGLSDVKFLILFFLICLAGILTQYHFVIVAGFFSIVFGIFLFRTKRYKLLILTFFTGLVSIALSIMIFPAMIDHLFGDSSLHALNGEQVTDLSVRFYEIIKTIYQSFFGIGLYIYIAVLVLGIILFFVIAKKDKSKVEGHSFTNSSIEKGIKILKNSVNNTNASVNFELDTDNLANKFLEQRNIYVMFLICFIVYYIVICLTSSFTFARYLYNIYPLIFIIIISPIYLLYKRIKSPLKFISIAMVLVLVITSKLYSIPFSLNAGDSIFHNFLNENKNTKMILLYRTVDKNGNENAMGTTSKWKLPRPLYSFKDMKNMTFVDISNIKKLQMSTSKSICNYDDLFLVIYTTENDESLIREVMKKNNVSKCDKIYFANYFHMYRLSK